MNLCPLFSRPPTRGDSDDALASCADPCRSGAKFVLAYLIQFVVVFWPTPTVTAEDGQVIHGEIGQRIADYVSRAHEA